MDKTGHFCQLSLQSNVYSRTEFNQDPQFSVRPSVAPLLPSLPPRVEGADPALHHSPAIAPAMEAMVSVSPPNEMAYWMARTTPLSVCQQG